LILLIFFKIPSACLVWTLSLRHQSIAAGTGTESKIGMPPPVKGSTRLVDDQSGALIPE
jgi:hypothetical protein